MLGHLVAPEVVERFEVRRKRELLADLKLWDETLASLTEDLGEERRGAGLAFYMEMPTSMKSPRMQALQAGLVQLSKWHSDTLAELAPLM
jgi:hypothetical protein